MIKYETITNIYIRIYRRVWRLLFRSNFKRFGNSYITFPLRIHGAKFIEIGNYVSIHKKVWLSAEYEGGFEPRLIIDDNVVIGNFVTISSMKDIHIEKNVIMADRVFISDNLHGYEDIHKSIQEQPSVFKNPVRIGDGSWIGVNAIIIGANIGKNCVIGANTVVTKDIPDYCVAVGIPARVIRRFNLQKGDWEKV